MYYDNFNYKFEDLGFLDDEIKIIRKIILMNNGFVIVNGLIGVGKLIILYIILREIDLRVLNIIILEDVVSFKVYWLIYWDVIIILNYFIKNYIN